MSHYYVIALVPRGTEDVEGKVEELLAPYDWDLMVPEHSARCCIGSLALLDIQERIDLKFGTLEELRRQFRDAVALDDRDREKWLAFVAPVFAAKKEMMDGHELRDEPDPTCPVCGGTGEFLTKHNSELKWDWWVVGGRWAGVLNPDYDPAEDPANQETCMRCGGGGTVPWDQNAWNNKSKATDVAPRRLIDGKDPQEGSPPEIDAGLIRSEEACAICEGLGRVPKFTGDWICEDDVAPAARLLSLLDRDIEQHCPSAVLTPDGEWHERGRMSWLACVSDEKPPSEWHEEVRTVVAAHADCLAVVCDLHV